MKYAVFFFKFDSLKKDRVVLLKMLLKVADIRFSISFHDEAHIKKAILYDHGQHQSYGQKKLWKSFIRKYTIFGRCMPKLLKGDAERSRGFPVSQCMDRNTSMAKTQAMFIEFIALPTAQVFYFNCFCSNVLQKALVTAYPCLGYIVEHAKSNLAMWASASSRLTSSTVSLNAEVPLLRKSSQNKINSP